MFGGIGRCTQEVPPPSDDDKFPKEGIVEPPAMPLKLPNVALPTDDSPIPFVPVETAAAPKVNCGEAFAPVVLFPKGKIAVLAAMAPDNAVDGIFDVIPLDVSATAGGDVIDVAVFDIAAGGNENGSVARDVKTC